MTSAQTNNITNTKFKKQISHINQILSQLKETFAKTPDIYYAILFGSAAELIDTNQQNSLQNTSNTDANIFDPLTSDLDFGIFIETKAIEELEKAALTKPNTPIYPINLTAPSVKLPKKQLTQKLLDFQTLCIKATGFTRFDIVILNNITDQNIILANDIYIHEPFYTQNNLAYEHFFEHKIYVMREYEDFSYKLKEYFDLK